MRNKLGPRVPGVPRRGQTAVMGEINRSIEKMSLGEMGGQLKPSGDNKTRNIGPGPATTVMMANNRRDSSWTVSTEGYGSMRSNTSASRRCSELSQVWKHKIKIVQMLRYFSLALLNKSPFYSK